MTPRRKPPVRHCAQCSAPFQTSKPVQRCCSVPCSRAWFAEHPRPAVPRRVINQVYTANSRAKKAGVEGRLTHADVFAVLHIGATCAYCPETEGLTIDHIVPMSLGGSNTRENIQPCCLSCNSSKSTVDRPWRWSLTTDACVECGSDEHPHHGAGVCTSCRMKEWRSRRSPEYLVYTRRRQRERYHERKRRTALARREAAAA